MARCFKCSDESAFSKEGKAGKIICSTCKRAICSRCSELSDTELQVFTLKNPKLTFVCNECDEGIRQVPELRKTVTEIQQKIEDMHLRQPHALNLDSIIYEMEERNIHGRNVVIFGIEESKSNSIEEKKRHDKNFIMQIFKSIQIPTEEIVTSFRQGRPYFHYTKSRPIKVVCSDRRTAINILKNKNKLPATIRVHSDMTAYQREQLQSLRDELALRTAQGEKDLTIKYINRSPQIIKLAKN